MYAEGHYKARSLEMSTIMNVEDKNTEEEGNNAYQFSGI